ncbi:methyltransferase [Echinicola pacifica]|uniref:Methyltransferase n=1 Tax=Echinicola pacifica TaxID=346377 RepID=A0A918PSC1_9BACT|nr:class I SAM-dependent methyltransferase [Echinicola pacifica]GGZ20319.1 methyltransferase [Echinicola pacifica]
MYEKLTKCPLCQSGHFRNHLVVKDHSVSQESFIICKCDECNFLFTNPRPSVDEIGKYYKSQNYISHTNKANNMVNRVYKQVRKITLKQKLNWVIGYTKTKGKRLLDYGCGTGHFPAYAQSKGWDTVGIEPNADAAKLASQDFGIKVYNNLAAIDKEKKFDAITLFHVLEHIHELDHTIHLLLSKLKSRGILLLAVPNHDSHDAAVYKENWAAYDVPRHLYHFNQESMARLAEKYNMKIVDTKPMIFDSYYVSLLSSEIIYNKKNIIESIKTGYTSNNLAKKDNNYSSLLFILKKK